MSSDLSILSIKELGHIDRHNTLYIYIFRSILKRQKPLSGIDQRYSSTIVEQDSLWRDQLETRFERVTLKTKRFKLTNYWN